MCCKKGLISNFQKLDQISADEEKRVEQEEGKREEEAMHKVGKKKGFRERLCGCGWRHSEAFGGGVVFAHSS